MLSRNQDNGRCGFLVPYFGRYFANSGVPAVYPLLNDRGVTSSEVGRVCAYAAKSRHASRSGRLSHWPFCGCEQSVPPSGNDRKQAQFDFGWRPEVSFDRITVAVLSASPLAQLFLAPLVHGSRAALELRRRRLQIKRSGSESFHSSIFLSMRNRLVVCQGGGPVISS